MARVRLIHWKAAEAAPLLDVLRQAGYQVDYEEKPDYRLTPAIRAAPPVAVVIDLSRLPSHGREIATYVRGSKATRHVPIVFVGGVAEKVEAIRQLLPDAVYTTAARLPAALRRAIRDAPAAPVVPTQMMDRFQSRTAAQKLGIAENSTVALFDPPRDYVRVLGELPPNVTLVEDSADGCQVALWFVRDAAGYQAALPAMRELAGRSKLWILWQKQAGRKQGGVTSQIVRESAIAVGLVDYKVCSVDETWSGLAFARKK